MACVRARSRRRGPWGQTCLDMTEPSSRNDSLLGQVKAFPESLTQAVAGTGRGARIRDRVFVARHDILRTTTRGSPTRFHRIRPSNSHIAVGEALRRPEGAVLPRPRGTDILGVASDGYEPEIARVLGGLSVREFVDRVAHAGRCVPMAARAPANGGWIIAVEASSDYLGSRCARGFSTARAATARAERRRFTPG